jgi:hypothetical protein
MGERQQAHGDAAGVFLALLGEQRLEGARVGRGAEQLIAVDEVEERHWLSAQRMDDVAVVDDVSGLCHVAVPRARRGGASGIVRPMRLRSATWPLRQCEPRDVFELRRDGVER